MTVLRGPPSKRARMEPAGAKKQTTKKQAGARASKKQGGATKKQGETSKKQGGVTKKQPGVTKKQPGATKKQSGAKKPAKGRVKTWQVGSDEAGPSTAVDDAGPLTAPGEASLAGTVEDPSLVPAGDPSLETFDDPTLSTAIDSTVSVEATCQVVALPVTAPGEVSVEVTRPKRATQTKRQTFFSMVIMCLVVMQSAVILVNRMILRQIWSRLVMSVVM